MIEHEAVLDWYADQARALPWRAPDRTPWGVLVSEIMLQQTPVVRVEPVWRTWMDRWPEPRALAEEEPGEVIRAWGRLGYPRRALRLHSSARVITERHGGDVPCAYDDLLALPGIGDYTAAAVAAFAFGGRHAVLDTNVRRVFARAATGRERASASPTAAERALAESLLPHDDAPTWSVAVMELGALVCTARSPRCGACPIAAGCAWRLAGSPAHDGPAPRSQAWNGTDRQARGCLMSVLRDSPGPVAHDDLVRAWPGDSVQRERALDGLIADGLVEPLDHGRFRLPASAPHIPEIAS